MSNYAEDYGKIALWYDDRDDSSTICTGKITIFTEDGEEEVNVYLYENETKKTDHSPDFFGFLKLPNKIKQPKSSTRKTNTQKRSMKRQDDAEDVAF